VRWLQIRVFAFGYEGVNLAIIDDIHPMFPLIEYGKIPKRRGRSVREVA
jgi:hypothetical protein